MNKLKMLLYKISKNMCKLTYHKLCQNLTSKKDPNFLVLKESDLLIRS